MAESPALLDAYLHLWDLIDRKSGLSTVEQHILFLTASFENDSEYCVAGHSGLAKVAGVDARHVEAVRRGAALEDPGLRPCGFGRRVVQSRGDLPEATSTSFWRPVFPSPGAGHYSDRGLQVVEQLHQPRRQDALGRHYETERVDPGEANARE